MKYQTEGYGQAPAALQNQPIGSVITNLPSLSDPRAQFQGWYFDQGLTKPVGNSFTLADDTVLFAKWNVKKTTVARAGTPSKAPFKDVSPSYAFAGEISWMGGTGISTGWADKTYRPYEPVERGAMAAFLYRFCSKHTDKCSPAVATNSYVEPMKDIFRDVRYKRRGNLNVSAFHKEIGWLADSGITTGWPDGTFRPVNYIDRNAMAAFIYRIKSNKR